MSGAESRHGIPTQEDTRKIYRFTGAESGPNGLFRFSTAGKEREISIERDAVAGPKVSAAACCNGC